MTMLPVNSYAIQMFLKRELCTIILSNRCTSNHLASATSFHIRNLMTMQECVTHLVIQIKLRWAKFWRTLNSDQLISATLWQKHHARHVPKENSLLDLLHLNQQNTPQFLSFTCPINPPNRPFRYFMVLIGAWTKWSNVTLISTYNWLCHEY